MSMYKLIEYSNACSKISGSIGQYYRDEPAKDDRGNIIDFPADSNNSNLFKFKQQITGQTGNGGRKDNYIMVTLKYLSNFWRRLEMPLINCKITPQLTCSKKCILVAGSVANQMPKVRTTDTKLYVPVVTLSTQDNIKLLKQVKSGFKRTINWNRYHLKQTRQANNRYLNHLIDPRFQGVNRLFVLSFEGDDGRKSYKQYYLPTVKIKDCNVMIHGRNFFNQPIKMI